jgi:L-threonylcarbamoyladenylate synthase
MRTIHTAKEASAALRRGEIIAMPTDTVYGLIAIAKKKAQKGIVAIKQSPPDKKILLLVDSIASAKKIVRIPVRYEKFLRLVWPGPVTAILKSKKNIPGFAGSTLALRVPKNRLLQTVMRSVRRPLTATSANISGKPTPRSYRAMRKHFADAKRAPDAIFVGRAKDRRALPSTLIACTGAQPRIIRQGATKRDIIEKAWARSGKKRTTR